MSIENIKQELLNKKLQLIEVDKNGVIIKSDNAIFTLKEGSNISVLNPFFTDITKQVSAKNNAIYFPCVNIVDNQKEWLVTTHLKPT